MLIHHYTSVDSLALILKHRTLRFTRADSLDDVQEAQEHAGIDFGTRYFVSSWTVDEAEQLPIWAMYGDAMRGVRLTLRSVPFDWHQLNFTISRQDSEGNKIGVKVDDLLAPFSKESMFGKGYVVVPDPEMKSSFGRPVEYVDDVAGRYRQMIRAESGSITVLGHGTSPAFLKSKHWLFQNEFRFVLQANAGPMADYRSEPHAYEDALCELLRSAFSGDPNTKRLGSAADVRFIDLPLSNEAFDNLTVTLGPLAPLSSEVIVNSLIAAHAPKTKIRKSQLHGQIRAKS